MRKIILAEHAGFCFGVKNTIDIALKQNGSVYTFGELIHNPQMIERLKKKGIKKIDSLEEIKDGTLIIRTHGVPPSIIERAKNKGLNIVDATCPFVKNVQRLAEKLEKDGYQVLIIGEEEHPEVVAIKGYAKNSIMINSVEQAEQLSFERAGVVCQTTQDSKNFKEIVKELRKNIKELKVHNTICTATRLRQKSALQLAEKVDSMIVVGGLNSANTKRLAKICSKKVKTYHIENEKDIKKEWLKDRIGITAGASTPNFIIEKVINKLKLCD